MVEAKRWTKTAIERFICAKKDEEYPMKNEVTNRPQAFARAIYSFTTSLVPSSLLFGTFIYDFNRRIWLFEKEDFATGFLQVWLSRAQKNPVLGRLF